MEKKELQFNDILLYTAPNGDVKVEVIYEDEIFWLTQKRMAELFGVTVSTTIVHLKNIFDSGELEKTSTTR